MKKIKNTLLLMTAFLAPLALELAYVTTNSVCFFLSYQPDEPPHMREMALYRKGKKK